MLTAPQRTNVIHIVLGIGFLVFGFLYFTNRPESEPVLAPVATVTTLGAPVTTETAKLTSEIDTTVLSLPEPTVTTESTTTTAASVRASTATTRRRATTTTTAVSTTTTTAPTTTEAPTTTAAPAFIPTTVPVPTIVTTTSTTEAPTTTTEATTSTTTEVQQQVVCSINKFVIMGSTDGQGNTSWSMGATASGCNSQSIVAMFNNYEVSSGSSTVFVETGISNAAICDGTQLYSFASYQIAATALGGNEFYETIKGSLSDIC